MSDTTHDHSRDVEYVERILARGFVLAGGVFWMLAAFTGPYVYEGISLASSLRMAAGPLLAAVMTLVIGWKYERLAALLLFAASSAVVVWGVLYAWEVGVWVIMSIVLIAPMLLSAALFTLAARSEEHHTAPAEELEGAHARVTEVVAATSRTTG
jgi:hypothetical protein